MPSSIALPGYASQGPAGKRTNIVELVGPVLYAAGGQTLTAAQFGHGGFDFVSCNGLSYSGTYFGRVQYLAVDAAPSALKGAVPSVKIKWFVVSTGAEAGAIDLSGEILRIFMILV